MMTVLPELATELGTTDRTLRRAANDGLIRGHRVSPRKFEMPLAERLYLRENWHLLSELRESLRTEPWIRAAVLFGSYARGDQHSGSDFDILVEGRPSVRLRDVAGRISSRLGRPVQLIALDNAETAPLLLAGILRDGRVLVPAATCGRGCWQLVRRSNDMLRASEDRSTLSWRLCSEVHAGRDQPPRSSCYGDQEASHRHLRSCGHTASRVWQVWSRLRGRRIHRRLERQGSGAAPCGLRSPGRLRKRDQRRNQDCPGTSGGCRLRRLATSSQVRPRC